MDIVAIHSAIDSCMWGEVCGWTGHALLSGSNLLARLMCLVQEVFFFKGRGQPSWDQEFPAWEQNPGSARGLDQQYRATFQQIAIMPQTVVVPGLFQKYLQFFYKHLFQRWCSPSQWWRWILRVGDSSPQYIASNPFRFKEIYDFILLAGNGIFWSTIDLIKYLIKNEVVFESIDVWVPDNYLTFLWPIRQFIQLIGSCLLDFWSVVWASCRRVVLKEIKELSLNNFRISMLPSK